MCFRQFSKKDKAESPAWLEKNALNGVLIAFLFNQATPNYSLSVESRKGFFAFFVGNVAHILAGYGCVSKAGLKAFFGS